ncbi:MAG: MBL fold metallo-hydrolase [Dehalococcoidales bacterium]|nr:MBL fold metallo-hydrolase [Dehalococcoidales bacterium]
MNIKILGAHNCESQSTRLTSLLVDDILALDAGGLTSTLSLTQQMKIKAVLLTHQHYDHIRDIPALAMNFYLHKASFDIYSSPAVYQALADCLMNGRLYPNFLKEPEPKPTINFTTVEPQQSHQIGSYNILTTASNHSVATTGYQVTAADGKTMFYTGDTGPGLGCWQQVSPDLLVIEVIAPNRFEAFAREKGHLTPSLLKQELTTFRKLKDYLPQVVLVHLYPDLEQEIKAEIDAVARSLEHPITISYEGMRVDL